MSRGHNWGDPEAEFERAAYSDVANSCDLICLSHLRWDFVWQRPQHLLSRFARERRVFFVEEPVLTDSGVPHMDIRQREGQLFVVIPHLPRGLSEVETWEMQKKLIDQMLHTMECRKYVLWYYTPMAMPFTRHLKPLAIAYDCMDELSNFKFAHPQLKDFEIELMRRADVVYTGGLSLYEFKRDRHHNIHPFPSSIDFAHFSKARGSLDEPEDQKPIPLPRVGFFGVIDERMDLELLRGVAERRTDCHFIMIGPVVKIDPATLPKLSNIHYLGGKKYEELPRYLKGWDVAMLPFARNESTRFISPTKTPEYLAAGCPVVSTSIKDVVRPYGEIGMVLIADEVEEFSKAIDQAFTISKEPGWQKRVDQFLAMSSWDNTWRQMAGLLKHAVDRHLLSKGEVLTLTPAPRMRPIPFVPGPAQIENTL